MYRIAMSGLLPTPLKSHYTFNVRDFAKVMQGIVKFNPIQGNTPFAAITSISTTF
jgi:dynein heavy chain